MRLSPRGDAKMSSAVPRLRRPGSHTYLRPGVRRVALIHGSRVDDIRGETAGWSATGKLRRK